MIFELPNFVSQEDLNFINLEISKVYDDPNIARQNPHSYRDGKTIGISDIKELSHLDELLIKIFTKLSGFVIRRYSPDSTFGSADTGYEFHRYNAGDTCHIHGDGEVTFETTSYQEESLLRFASVVLHLNTPSSGGETVFPTLNKTIKTEAGKIVIFPPYGFAQHYTTESCDPRDVIVTWFVYKNLLVRRI